MIERLSELLGDEFKVLFIKKWTHESQTFGTDYTLKNGYFDLILTSPYIDNEDMPQLPEDTETPNNGVIDQEPQQVSMNDL